MTTLAAAEKAITTYQTSYVEASKAILDVFQEELWKKAKPEYLSFEEYCEGRWGFKRSKSYQMMDAGRLLLEFDTQGTEYPKNESIARQLMRVKKFDKKGGSYTLNDKKTWELRGETWKVVLDRTDGKPTAADVKEISEAHTGRGHNAGPSVEKQKASAKARLETALEKIGELNWTKAEIKELKERIDTMLSWLRE